MKLNIKSKETKNENKENIRILNESEQGLKFNPKLAEAPIEFWCFKKDKPNIDKEKFIDFLQNNGFRKYLSDSNSEIELVHVDQGIAIRVDAKHIKQFVINYLEENNYLSVKEHVSGLKYLFQMPFLDALSPIDIDEVRYTMSEVNMPGKVVIVRKLKSSQYMGGTGNSLFPMYYSHILQKRKLKKGNSDTKPICSEVYDTTNIVFFDDIPLDFNFASLYSRIPLIKGPVNKITPDIQNTTYTQKTTTRPLN